MISSAEPQEPQEKDEPEQTPGPAGPLRRYWLWIALSAAVVLAVVAAVTIPGHGNAFPAAGSTSAGTQASAGTGGTGGAGGRAGPANSSARPNPDATQPVPSAIPSPAGAASSPLPRRLAASLARWKAGRGGAALAVLTAQMGNAMQAGGLKLYPTMRQACAKLGDAVTAARSSPPIPDAAMQGGYARALATLGRAAAACRAGISVRPQGDENTQTGLHPKALSRSRAEFATGARELFRATGKIAALGQR